MPYALKDRLFVSILFNGQEFPFETNSLDFLHMSSSVRTALPILTFKVTDVKKFLTLNNFLVDGTRITVTAGKEQQKTAYNFRLFSFKEIPSNSPEYKIHAYLDAPLYWASSLVEAQKGTSNEVLKKMADRCGMTYSGVNTSDSQNWLPQNLTIREFVRQVAYHGWANDSSCMQAAVTLDRVLRYRNVSDFDTYPVKDFFATTKVTDKIKPMTDYAIVNRAGFMNVTTGYQETRVVQSVIEEDDAKHSSLTFKKNSAKLMMSADVKSQVDRNKFSFAPVDVGNTHANYEKAAYQNRRMGNLFALGLDMMTPEFSSADLLDVVNIEMELPDVKGSRQYSGKYLVLSKVIYVQGGNYYEKLELARHGLNEPKEDTQG